MLECRGEGEGDDMQTQLVVIEKDELRKMLTEVVTGAVRKAVEEVVRKCPSCGEPLRQGFEHRLPPSVAH
jgi:uncharacterized protein with PIN domain